MALEVEMVKSELTAINNWSDLTNWRLLLFRIGNDPVTIDMLYTRAV
jgi:hypothetical protein